jgi:hypothetical protein
MTGVEESRLRSRTPFRIGLGSVLFVAAAVLPLFRQAGARSWDTIWAEDGQIYSQQPIRDGGIAALLRTHGGYLQLAPRLLGAVAPLVPLRRLSLYLALAATVTCALLAAFLFHASQGWISSRPVRLALASLVVLAPVLGLENTATITNTIWTFGVVAPWALVSLRDRGRAVAVRAAVAFLAATSTVVSVVFLPLALAVAAIRRTPRAWVVSGMFVAGLGVQTLAILTAHDSLQQAMPNSVAELLELIGVRVFALALVGVKWTTWLWSLHPEYVSIGAAVAMSAIFAVLYPGAGRRAQVLAAAFLAYALVTFVVPVWARGTSYCVMFGGAVPNAHLRYSVIPTMMLSSAAAVLLAPCGPGRSRLVARLGRPLFVAHVLVLTLAGFSIRIPRSASTSWPAEVEKHYRAECVGAPGDKLVTIQFDYFAGFPVTLPCSRLAP